MSKGWEWMASDESGFTFAVVGESMATRPFSRGSEPAFRSVMSRMQAADITYAHLEGNLGHFHEVGAPARSDQIGSYFLADPRIAADLRWAGVDVASLAHNHSFDFGAPGILSTIQHVEAAGIAHAGTGRDLEEAREPGFVETAHGRVGLVAVSSGNNSHEWATLPKATLPGRAGVNPLRPVIRHLVDQPAAETLRAMGSELGILRESKAASGPGLLAFSEPREFSLALPTAGANLISPSDHFEITSSSHPGDRAGNLRSVEQAAAWADIVVVAHHCSVSEGPRGDRAPAFMREFAHACIDHGADMYIGHGWHRTLGIEIYGGKPIFYGVGNFFAQTEFIRRVPYDGYESHGHDVEALSTLHPAMHPLHPGIGSQNAGNSWASEWWSSALIELQMTADRQISEIRLYPVELGRAVGSTGEVRRRVGKAEEVLTDGRPFLAQSDDADHVLDRYQRLSAELGTTVEISGQVGVIEL